MSVLRSTQSSDALPEDAYCRRCETTFSRPLPAPYGAICQACFAEGHIVTLTEPPPGRRFKRRRRA